MQQQTYRRLMSLPILSAMIAVSIVSHMSQAPQPDLGIEFGDKVLHAAAYTILGLLFAAALDAWRDFEARSLALWTILFCALFGIYDEIHQSFIPNRFADVFDWLADCLGGVFAALLSGRVQAKLRSWRSKHIHATSATP